MTIRMGTGYSENAKQRIVIINFIKRDKIKNLRFFLYLKLSLLN